jgi:hypothetical protein
VVPTILGGTSHGRGYGWRIGLIRQFRAVLGGLSRTIVASKSLAPAFGVLLTLVCVGLLIAVIRLVIVS